MAALYNAPPAKTVAVMLLVDNNHFTKIAWSDLRDQCLPALFSRLSSVHPSAPITTFVQESCSTNDQTLIEIPPAHREYYAYQDAIQDVRFNSTLSCRLTAPLINGAIQFLSSTTSIARHIIIIGSSSVHNVYSSHNDNWHRLAKSLALGSIYCHLMLHASTVSPTEPLNLLFDEALRLQKMVEDKPWFSNNRSLIIPRLSPIRNPVPQVVPLEVASPMINPGPASLPPSLERNILPTSIRPMYPQAPSASTEEEALPSLVTQLQQMHGLTKKKVYGTKPKRRPFVSAEVYREHPRKASSLSPVLPSDTNHGGRVTSPSLIDRASRVLQNGTPLSHSSALRSMSDVGPSTSSSELDPSRVLQNGVLLAHPSASRSILDVRTSSSPTELDPVSSYFPPTTIPISSPASSPVLNHAPPSWNPSMSPLQSGYQQYPTSSAPHVHTVPRSATYPVDHHHSVGKLPTPGLLDTPPITQDDGGASSPHNNRPYLKPQGQNPSINTTSYSSHPSLYYRNEQISHHPSDHHFTQGPGFSTSYPQNTQIIDSSSPLGQPGHWNYDPLYASQQISNQNGVAPGHSAASSHPPSPGSSTSSSLTGWAG